MIFNMQLSEDASLAELSDIRVGVDGTVYPSAGDAVRGQITDVKEDIAQSLNINYKKIPRAGQNVSGEIILNDSFSLDCYKVAGGMIFDIEMDSTTCVYTFHVDEPVMDGQSYNNSRTVVNTVDAKNIIVPTGCNWVAIRVDINNEHATINPISSVIESCMRAILDTTTSLDTIKENSYRYVPSTVETSPLYNTCACVVETVRLVEKAYIQTAYAFTGQHKGLRYMRTFIANAWTDWVSQDEYYKTDPLYYAYGDSLMYGAKWVDASQPPYYSVVRTPEINQIPTRIAHAIGAEYSFHNEAVGGSTLVNSGDNTILSKIQNTNMNNVKLITVGGGRNDSSNQLGTRNATSGDGTICGAVKEIIEYLQLNYPKAQIVWIGVTPNPGSADNSKVFTYITSGGWSLNTFDEEVSAVCANYCVPYVNWKECSYMIHWADFTGAGGNYAHPNNDESYLQMGNYIAGKVSKYYKG